MGGPQPLSHVDRVSISEVISQGPVVVEEVDAICHYVDIIEPCAEADLGLECTEHLLGIYRDLEGGGIDYDVNDHVINLYTFQFKVKIESPPTLYTMSLESLKSITAKIRAGQNDSDLAPDLVQDMGVLDEIMVFCQSCSEDEIADLIPRVWTQWLESRFINPIWNPKFWDAVSSKECYMYTKYSRRFFPMVGSAEWKELSKECYKANYPEFEKAKYSNIGKGSNLKLHTNFGMVPPLDTERIEVETRVTTKLMNLAISMRDRDMQDKLWWVIATSYEMCHTLLKMEVGRQLTRKIWDRDRDFVQAGLFWTNYILAHEEQTSQMPTEESRFVFTLEELNHLSFLNNLPPDTTPWIINAMRNGNNVYNSCPFYLQGERSVSTPAEAQRRITHLTQDCFQGFERFTNSALTGSTLMQSLCNNALLRPPAAAADGMIQLADDRPHHDIAAFDHRSRLYFPRDGDMSSDLDVVVSTTKNKEFIPIADAMVALLNENLNRHNNIVYAHDHAAYIPCAVVHDCTASGVRYHVTHPRLGIKIEIFRSPQARMKLVSGFHVPPARMYWDFGKRWYLTRSCAAALVTGISENFNWFSSNKVPADVILKYAQRGITTILNLKELECLEKYLQKSERWGYGFYKIAEITGAFRWDHPFFRVDAQPRGVRWGLPVIEGTVGNWRANVYKLARTVRYKDTDFSKRYIEHDNTFRVCVPPRLFTI